MVKYIANSIICRGPPAEAIASAIAGRWRKGYWNMYYTYVLRSELDRKLYIGWTSNLKHRIAEHNNGNVTATKGRRPLELVYYEACNSKEKAIQREKTLKTGFGRKYITSRIA